MATSLGKALASPGVSYEMIGHLSAAELTQACASQFSLYDVPLPEDPKDRLTPPTLAKGVSLYRIYYALEIDHPRFNGSEIVSGLLVIPDSVPGSEGLGVERALPLAMYNHGTLFNRQQAPSRVVVPSRTGGEWEVESYETLINLGLLAQNDYALIAADYIGCGINSFDEAYGVKQPTIAAIVGLLEASRSVMPMLGVRPAQLFLNGWSQGGLNTQWAVQGLETLQIPVAAAAAASPFNELRDTARWWLSRSMANPRVKDDPSPWLPLCASLLLKSYESWCGLQGLVDAVVKDEVIPDGIASDGKTVLVNSERVTYREIIKRFAEYGDQVVPFASISNDSWMVNVVRNGVSIWTSIPGFAGEDMLVEGVLDQQQGVVREFLQKLEADSPRYWEYKTPLKAWYGQADEALPMGLVDPGMKDAGGPQVTLQKVAGDWSSHRQTYLNSLLARQAKAGEASNLIDWFAEFRKPASSTPSLVVSQSTLEVVSEDFGLLPVRLAAEGQSGERPMHLQLLRLRQDGNSEVIGSLGGTTARANQLQTLGNARVLLQVGDKLGFQLLSRSGTAVDTSSVQIIQGIQDQAFTVVLRATGSSEEAILKFSVIAEPQNFTASVLDSIAAPQGAGGNGLFQLRQGQKVSLDVATDCAFRNRLGFVRLNQDPVTGLVLNTVGDKSVATDSLLFREQIDSLLDPGFQVAIGGRRASSDLQWTIRQDGVYAAVLITPEGNVFCGASGAIGSQQVRDLGRNSVGFEDLVGIASDFDWNDVVVRIGDVV